MERQYVEITVIISEYIQLIEDEEPFLGAFINHSGPVHGLQVHEGFLYTCSGDNTARAYSLVVCSSQTHFGQTVSSLTSGEKLNQNVKK